MVGVAVKVALAPTHILLDEAETETDGVTAAVMVMVILLLVAVDEV